MRQRILIIEDEPDLLQMLAELFSGEGFEVRTARNGLQAIQTVNFESIDLVISDMQMPKLDGLAIARHIQGLIRRPKLILLSGSPKPPMDRIIAAEISAFIQKPIDFQILLNAVNQFKIAS